MTRLIDPDEGLPLDALEIPEGLEWCTCDLRDEAVLTEVNAPTFL